MNPNIVTAWLRCLFPLPRVSAERRAAWTSQGLTAWPRVQRGLCFLHPIPPSRGSQDRCGEIGKTFSLQAN